MTAEFAVQLSAALIGVGILWRSISLIANWKELKTSGLLAGKSDLRLLVIIRGLLAVPLICGMVPPYLLGSLFVIELIHHRKFRRFAMAWFAMELVVLAGLSLASLDPADELLANICLLFIAGVAVLAYLKNGLVKAQSRSWRSGRFFAELFQETRFRLPRLGKFFSEYPWVSKFACWIVILFELAFPLAIFGGERIAWTLLLGGCVFHLGIAMVLRLPGFFWVFIATYPAILSSERWFQNWILN